MDDNDNNLGSEEVVFPIANCNDKSSQTVEDMTENVNSIKTNVVRQNIIIPLEEAQIWKQIKTTIARDKILNYEMNKVKHQNEQLVSEVESLQKLSSTVDKTIGELIEQLKTNRDIITTAIKAKRFQE